MSMAASNAGSYIPNHHIPSYILLSTLTHGAAAKTQVIILFSQTCRTCAPMASTKRKEKDPRASMVFRSGE